MEAADTPTQEAPRALPYDRIGGEEAVRAIVERFYDLMELDPHYAELRAMHDEDLLPMRVSLTQFLCAWLGGPRTWFEQRPGACIMSAHRGMGITGKTARQWIDAMSRALEDNRVDTELRAQMLQAFSRMAGAMQMS